MRIQTGAVAAALLALTAVGASAHARLEHADPRVGAHVTSSPTQVRLWFGEGVEAKFSAIALESADGKTLKEDAAVSDPKDRKQLVLPLKQPLAPGVYRVRWRAVSIDSHRTQGDFTFTVGR
jgi:hypothetical protein